MIEGFLAALLANIAICDVDDNNYVDRVKYAICLGAGKRTYVQLA
jgi:hypothetical protein